MAKKTSITTEPKTTKSETIKAALAKLRCDAKAALQNIGNAQSVDAIVADVAVASLAGSDVEKALQKQYHLAVIDEIKAERAGIQSEIDAFLPVYAAAVTDEEKRRESFIRADEAFDGLTAEQVINSYAAWVHARKTLAPLTERREALRASRDDCDKRIEAEREALRRLEAPKALTLAALNGRSEDGAAVLEGIPDAGNGGRAIVEPMR